MKFVNAFSRFKSYLGIFRLGLLCFLFMLSCVSGKLMAQGSRRDTTICTGTCAVLVESNPIFSQTDTYQVRSIPFVPPVTFQMGNLVGMPTDDIWSSPIPIGFNFCYYGNTFSELLIGPNGIVSFDTSRANQFCNWAINHAIPDSNAIDNGNCIMAPFQDIDPSENNREPAYGIVGTAPYRKFFINWDSIPLFSCNNLYIRSQLVLHETSNRVEIYLEHKALCPTWNSGASILGMQDSAALRATIVPGHNYPTLWVANQEAWAFEPISPNTASTQWFEGSQFLGNGDSITVCPATLTSFFAKTTGINCNGDSVIFTDTIVVHIRPQLAPAPIIGPNVVNAGQTGVNYSIPLVTGAVGYGWTLQGGTFVGGSNWRQVVVDWGTAGPFSLCVWPIDNHQCAGDTVCLSISVDTEPASALQNVQLWPNPATTELRLRGDFAGKSVTFEIMDLSGKMVLQRQLLAEGNDIAVPLSTLEGGYYFLRLQADDAARVLPFVHLMEGN